MIPKIIFSFMVWLSGLSIICIATVVYAFDELDSFKTSIKFSIIYSSCYTFNIVVTSMNLLGAAAYLWWLSAQSLNPRASASKKRTTLDHFSVRNDKDIDWKGIED